MMSCPNYARFMLGAGRSSAYSSWGLLYYGYLISANDGTRVPAAARFLLMRASSSVARESSARKIELQGHPSLFANPLVTALCNVSSHHNTQAEIICMMGHRLFRCVSI